MHLRAIGIDDANGDDSKKPVKQVEFRWFDFLFIDDPHAKDHLDKHADLHRDCEPPQRPVS